MLRLPSQVATARQVHRYSGPVQQTCQDRAVCQYFRGTRLILSRIAPWWPALFTSLAGFPAEELPLTRSALGGTRFDSYIQANEGVTDQRERFVPLGSSVDVLRVRRHTGANGGFIE